MTKEDRNTFANYTPGASTEDVYHAENGMFKDSKGDYRDNRGATYGPGGIPNLTFPNTKGWEWDGQWAHSEGTGLNPNDYKGLEPSFYQDPDVKLRVRKPEAAWNLPGAMNFAQAGTGTAVPGGSGAAPSPSAPTPSPAPAPTPSPVPSPGGNATPAPTPETAPGRTWESMYPYVPKDQTRVEAYFETADRMNKAYNIGNNASIPETDDRRSQTLKTAAELQEELNKRRLEQLLPEGAALVLEEIKNTLQGILTPSPYKK